MSLTYAVVSELDQDGVRHVLLMSHLAAPRIRRAKGQTLCAVRVEDSRVAPQVRESCAPPDCQVCVERARRYDVTVLVGHDPLLIEEVA